MLRVWFWTGLARALPWIAPIGVPANGATVQGAVPLSAGTPVTGAGRVQFLVDGNVVGTSTDAASPYRLSWDSTTVPDGSHWVTARATDAQGRINTTSVAVVANAQVDRGVAVRQCLRCNTLTGIHHQQRTFAGGQ